METIFKRLVEYGCSITPVQSVPSSIIVGLAGRDIICFVGMRSKEMQRFADTWSGAPPVDLLSEGMVDNLVEAILAGEYDADSRYQREEIIFRLRQ